KGPATIAAEHIHRETVVEKRRPPYALIGTIGVLAAIAVASRPAVRENVGTWWREKAANSPPPEVFARDRGNDRPNDGGSSGSAAPSPPPPNRESSRRMEPSGEPTNTRVGDATPQGAASGNPGGGGSGGRTFDIFPKTAGRQTPPSDASRSASTERTAGTRPGAVAPKTASN